MTKHPLLCNSEVVRAILDGRQKQDRRPFKQMVEANARGGWLNAHDWRTLEGQEHLWYATDSGVPLGPFKSPYGKPGDVLWVRETWATIDWKGKPEGVGGHYHPPRSVLPMRSRVDLREIQLVYRADGDLTMLKGWRPSIHMPKWACRLRLTVKRVWVEQVQDISLEDCAADGGYTDPTTDWRWSFMDLWNSLYPGSWDRNDLVFACEFDTITADS